VAHLVIVFIKNPNYLTTKQSSSLADEFNLKMSNIKEKAVKIFLKIHRMVFFFFQKSQRQYAQFSVHGNPNIN